MYGQKKNLHILSRDNLAHKLLSIFTKDISKVVFRKWLEFFNRVEKSIPSDLNSKSKSIHNGIFRSTTFKKSSKMAFWDSKKNMSI